MSTSTPRSSWLDRCPAAVAGYEDYAPFYDSVFDDVTDDIEFWCSLPRSESVVCEMGCGTGRVTAHLASVARTVGVDPSPAMLEEARKRLPAADLRRGGLSAIPASDGEFDQVLCIRGAFSHLISPLDQVAAIGELARVLRAGGLLVVDVPHHGPADPVASGPTELRFMKEREHEGRTYEYYVETIFDPVWRYYDATQHVLIKDGAEDAVALRTIRLRTKVLSMPELSALLALGGFEIEDVWGGYDRRPFDATSERLVVAARRSGRS